MALPSAPIPAALSLAGLPRDRSVRDWIEWTADQGFRGVALDGMAAGARARDLGRGARRDLASLLRRRELSFLGVDLWIPAAHFASPEHQDRAFAATIGAIELARDLATLNGDADPVLSVCFPAADDLVIRKEIDDAAMGAGVMCANHAWPFALEDGANIGLDPATVLLAGQDPATELLRCAGKLGCVRLSDADQSGRAAVGSGRLEIDAFRMAMMGVNWRRPLLIDVRGLADGGAAAKDALRRWAGQG